MSQYVVWFDSSEQGAPVLNNAAGSLISVLDACLVTGFNTKSITSLVVAGGVATATCAGHGFSGTYGKDLRITGATPAGLNGRKALTFVDANTFKFDATGISDQTATGTITAKRDPLGWVKQFTGTNKAIYKRSDVTATSLMLRIDDTNTAPATATDARSRMVESATDVDTFAGPTPTDAQVNGGQYINKGVNNATAKQWSLVGDGKRFFLVTQHGSVVLPSVASAAHPMFFGDFVSLKAGDAYNCLLCGSHTAFSGAAAATRLSGAGNFATPTVGPNFLARPYTQVGSSVGVNLIGMADVMSGAGSSQPVYPSPIDSGLVLLPNMLISESSAVYGNPVRGFMPAICQLIAQLPFSHYQIIEPVVSLPGRKVLALSWYQTVSVTQVGLDITGPWG